MNRYLVVAVALVISWSSLAAQEKRAGKPNIVVILADDMGYSDLGCYGSEIKTPNLDRLASKGLRFTNFYNTARCCPSRAALLTGLYSHQAGMGGMNNDQKKPGYRGELNRNCLTIAEVLRNFGYWCGMIGKWHLTKAANMDGPTDTWPRQRGFDRYFGTLQGAGSYFQPGTLTRDNTRIKAEPGFYYTDAISDHAVSFIHDQHKAKPEQPMFLYVAYTAPHWPLHAIDKDIAKYEKTYLKGWDALYQERYERMKTLGVVDPNWPVPPRDKQVPAWASLDDAKKKEMAHKMAVYAAQIDRLDQGVGRIVDALKKTKRLDDTLILFMADNGGCEEGGIWGFERKKGGVVGEDSSFASYGRGWAWLSNCIFRLFKHWVHGGGVRTPLIAHWPNGIDDQNKLRRQPAHLVDVMATCVELSGAKYPTEYQGQKITPLEGKSLVPAFANKPLERDAIYWEHEGNRAVLVKNWKLVAVGAKGPWELYDLDKDGAETNDLAKERPEIAMDLAAKWQAWAVRAHVVDPPKGIGEKKVVPKKKDAETKKTDIQAPYVDWKHSGSVYLLSTPEGANLPASATEKDFPLLVRLHKDLFDFKQAKANGDDLRFATSTGKPLAYQIDEWDAVNGHASIWVRIPTIKGNARQEIKLYWGKADAASESNGKAVFNESNGYLSVWHMTDPARDDVGTLASINQGTTTTRGIIGQARRFDIGKGIRCGENITNYPSGSDSHTSEAWVRADKPNGRVLAWGIEKGQGKVVMQVASPPHIQMECYFSGANVSGTSKLPMAEWVHVVHTYKKGESRVYVNGKLDGVTTTPNAPLNIPAPAKMWIGGWYNNYNFVGDIDEVRVSNTTGATSASGAAAMFIFCANRKTSHAELHRRGLLARAEQAPRLP